MKYNKVDFSYVKRLKENRVPLLADFELTDRCNLNCIHCCFKSDNNNGRHKELNTPQLFNILGQMKDAGVIYINLSGGEPLFRRDFKDIYLFAKKKNFAVTVITNGTLITKGLIELFEKYPPLILEITGYGITQESYESVTRTPGSFAMFKKAIGMIEGSGIRFNIRTMVMKENYNEIIKKHRNIKMSGMRCVIASLLNLRRDRNRLKNELIIKQRLDVKETSEFFKKFPEGSIASQKKRYPDYRYLDHCQCNTLGGIVLPDGTFSVCQLIPESRFNLKNISFIEAWKNSLDREPLLSKQDAACGDCEYKAYCKWCPGRAYLETGSQKARIPYLCQAMEMMHKKGG